MAPQQRHRVVVIGGANTDIVGVSDEPLVPRDSNPGAAVVSAGGVARNVAENLARLGVETHLLTAFGGDHDGRALREDCRTLGIDVSAALHDTEAPGSRYIAIMDADGDLALALNDMRAIERVTPAVLEERRDLLESADLLVADCNLPAASLEWLAERAGAPVVVDPVSVAKAPRVSSALGGIHTLKANVLEVGALAGEASGSHADVARAASALLDRGVSRVFVTLGARGAYCADGESSVRVGSPSVRVVNATGAGDAFTAGVAYATLDGRDLAATVRFATAMAVLTLESERSVSERVEADVVESTAEELPR
jgi:pseudouridine kinase